MRDYMKVSVAVPDVIVSHRVYISQLLCNIQLFIQEHTCVYASGDTIFLMCVSCIICDPNTNML